MYIYLSLLCIYFSLSCIYFSLSCIYLSLSCIYLFIMYLSISIMYLFIYLYLSICLQDDSSEGNSIDTTPDSSRAKPPTQHPTYIPNYFSVSPLALAPGGPNSGFSPSIFLTRPPPTHHIPPTHINEHSPPDTCSTDIITASTPSYMTSTPIRSRNMSNDNNKPFCMESSPSQTQSPITGAADCSKGHYEQIASISEVHLTCYCVHFDSGQFQHILSYDSYFTLYFILARGYLTHTHNI